MNPKPLRWAVLGISGYLSRAAMPQLFGNPRLIVARVGARDAEMAREKLASIDTGDVEFCSLDEVLGDETIDVVYIQLPNGLHSEWVARAIAANKAVLCEKPIMPTADLLEQLRELTGRPPVMEAIMYRFHPRWQLLMDLISSGKLGTPIQVLAHYAYLDDEFEGPRFSSLLRGGVTNMVGCYPVDACNAVFQRSPSRVSALMHSASSSETDTVSGALLDYGGRFGLVSASVESFDSQSLRIIGTRGTAILEWPYNTSPDEDSFILLDTEDGRETLVVEPADQFAIEFDSFNEAVANGSPPKISFDDSWRLSSTLQAIHESASHGGTPTVVQASSAKD